MPMDRKRYPENWEEVALQVKTKANWTCSRCGLKCISPDEENAPTPSTNRSEWAKRTLTVHHADYDPSNNHKNNLIPLCAPCHLLAHRWQKGNVTEGQLKLNLGV